jgi:hypothetical protein
VGWTGFGLLHADLEFALRSVDLAYLRGMFEDCGITYVELEFLGDWWTEGERRRQSDRRRDLLLRAAEALGAGAIKIGGELGDEPVDPDRFNDEFDRLATQAADAGTRIAIEPMPMSNLATIAAGASWMPCAGACRLRLRRRGARAGGIEVISAEHRQRGCVDGLGAAYRATQRVLDGAAVTRTT